MPLLLERDLSDVLFGREDVLDAEPVNVVRDDIPKIGGSSGGFIALVVSLSAFVLFCCIGVFILLRNHEPDAYERHARRVISGKPGSNLYETPLGPKGMREKFRKMFTFGRKREGWIQANAGDGDEWDASDHLPYTMRSMSDKDAPFVPPARTSFEDKYMRPGIQRSSTSDEIELSPPPKHSVDDNSPPHSPHVYLPHPPRSNDDRSPSRSSTGHTFENGTRFREALDY